MLESLSPPNMPQMLLLATTSHVSSPHRNTVYGSQRKIDGGMGEEDGKGLRSPPGWMTGRNMLSS